MANDFLGKQIKGGREGSKIFTFKNTNRYHHLITYIGHVLQYE